MKKTAIITALLALIIGMTACGEDTKTTDASETTTAVTTAAVTEAETTVETTAETAAETTAETTEAATEAETTENASAELSDDDCRTALEPLLKGLNDIDCIAASALECDITATTPGSQEGVEYVKVTDERFKSTADIDAFLNTYLSKEFRASSYDYIIDSENPMYIDKDGALYMMNGGRGCGFKWTETPAEISDKTESGFTAIKEYNLFDSPEKVKLGAVLTEDGWRLGSFEYVE